MSSGSRTLNIEQPEKFEYRSARKCSDIGQPEKFEYRACRNIRISSIPKTLNIEQPEQFEYRLAALKSLNTEQLLNLDTERPEKLEY